MNLNEEDELVSVAMEIILDAGDARNKMKEALAYTKKYQFDKAKEAVSEAKGYIEKAHGAQTGIIQDEARGIEHKPSLLFTHAQDTLMTIMSEVQLGIELIEMFELINQRFDNLKTENRRDCNEK